MKISLMLLAVALLAACGAHALDVPSAADQIASAVLAAPEDRRARAGVQGYNAQGERVTLREGDNDLICRADNPKRERFSVRCRHRDVEAYFARNRELRAQGLRGKERQAAPPEGNRRGQAVVGSATNRIPARRQWFRCRFRRSDRLPPRLFDLRALRHARDDRVVDQFFVGCTLADVLREAAGAHYDQPEPAEEETVGAGPRSFSASRLQTPSSSVQR